jgi:hypothetical protein
MFLDAENGAGQTSVCGLTGYRFRLLAVARRQRVRGGRTDAAGRALGVIMPPKTAGFPCFSRKSRYIPRHLTRKHGSKGRPVATGPQGSFAHTFPEEPTGELDYGASRFFYASAA